MEDLDQKAILLKIQDSLTVENEIDDESRSVGESQDKEKIERKEEKESEELKSEEAFEIDELNGGTEEQEGEEKEDEGGEYGDDPDSSDGDSENDVALFEGSQSDLVSQLQSVENNDIFAIDASFASLAVAKAFEVRGRQYHPHHRLLKMKGKGSYLDSDWRVCYGYLLVVSLIANSCHHFLTSLFSIVLGNERTAPEGWICYTLG